MTQERKHTKAPWHVIPRYGRGNEYELWDGNDNYPDDMTPKAMDGNACLMAAAPSLLEACKALVALCGRTGYHPTGECKLAESAIARAEGRD